MILFYSKHNVELQQTLYCIIINIINIKINNINIKINNYNKRNIKVITQRDSVDTRNTT